MSEKNATNAWEALARIGEALLRPLTLVLIVAVLLAILGLANYADIMRDAHQFVREFRCGG